MLNQCSLEHEQKEIETDFQDENPITKTVQHLKIFERDGGR